MHASSMLNTISLLYLGLFVLAAGSTRAADVELWDGTVKSGKITYGKSGFTINGKEKFKRSQVFEVRFGGSGEKSDQPRITFTDGSQLTGKVLPAGDFANLKVVRSSGRELTFAGAAVSSIEFAPLNTGAKPDSSPDTPHIIMKSGKVIDCTPQWLTFLDLGVKAPAGDMRIKLASLNRLVFRKPGKAAVAKTTNVCVRTRQGDSVTGFLLLINRKELKLRCAWGDLIFPVSDLFVIESLSKRIVPLLTLKPAKVRETPFLEFIRPHRLNQSMFGGSLRIDNMRFEKGFAVHSRTSLTFNLGGGYSRFVTHVGIDSSLTDRGEAVFAVRGDGKPLKELNISGKSGITYVSVPVSGVKSLELLIDYGKGGSGGDHGVWANPRLIR